MQGSRFGISASVPSGWSLRIDRRPGTSPDAARLAPGVASEVTHPVLHAASIALPEGVGDFGGGAMERLGRSDIFIALVEFGDDVADQGLFAAQGVPRLAPSHFAENRMAQYVPGLSASQKFFSAGGRAFCLYAVIGSHARRMALAPQADRVASSFRLTDARTLNAQRGRS